MRHVTSVGTLVALVVFGLLWAGCSAHTHTAVKPSWTYSDFQEPDFDPFPGMNFQGRDVELTAEELSGRILWNLWTGDNSAFWNYLAKNAFGTTDLLKVVASPRSDRFATYGVMNQPGYARPAQPDKFGLFIDEPKSDDVDLDKNLDERTYGHSSGVHGLRLFPNIAFDEADWDDDKYWHDPNYYSRKDLERPYLVGMTCSFCHTGPDPVNPPADPAEPQYANLSDYVGQHYMKVWEVFAHDLPEDNFVKQLLMTNPPGTLDTSFIATDYLNNPGTMNGIYEIAGRLQVTYPETVVGGALDLLNLDLDENDRQPTPRVLKEGADSVGFYGALSRVHLNIGEYWEEWIRHFKPLIGIKKQTPIRVADAQALSPHWNWSESHSPDLARYFLRVAKPHKLADAPGGDRHLTDDPNVLNLGKKVFAESCARCHSSKQPPAGVRVNSPEGREWFVQAVQQDDFLDGNFLASERRYPVTEIRTNATRAVARNALDGHIWDNFSSETYKTLPPVGAIDVWDPFTGQSRKWTVPGDGRGYYRPPSLVSIWASAPFFHHNALGKHVHGVSVDERLAAFDDAVEKLLWPEKREGEGSIWRTTTESWLQVPESYLHGALARKLRKNMQTDPETGAQYFAFGPIPKGTPVNLVSNLDLELNGFRKAAKLAKFGVRTVKALKEIRRNELVGDDATQRLMELVPDMYELSACPDFVEDKGHYYGTDLTDREKRALIAFLKTL